MFNFLVTRPATETRAWTEPVTAKRVRFQFIYNYSDCRGRVLTRLESAGRGHKPTGQYNSLPVGNRAAGSVRANRLPVTTSRSKKKPVNGRHFFFRRLVHFSVVSRAPFLFFSPRPFTKTFSRKCIFFLFVKNKVLLSKTRSISRALSPGSFCRDHRVWPSDVQSTVISVCIDVRRKSKIIAPMV